MNVPGLSRFFSWLNLLSLQSMRGRMALLLGAAMLPAGFVAMQVGLSAVSVRESVYEESLARRALQSISQERSVIDEVRELARVLSASPDIQRVRGAPCRDFLSGIIRQYPDIATIAVTSEAGDVLCSYPAAPEGMAPQPSELRRIARARGSLVMGYVEKSRLIGTPVLAAMTPLQDAERRRIGFIGLTVRVDRLRQILDASRDPNGGRIAIVDSKGQIIAASSLSADASAPGLPTQGQIRAHEGADPSFVYIRNGAAVIAPLSPPDLYVVMSWPPDMPVWRRWLGYGASLAAPLFIWALAVAAGWFAIEIYVARPLSSLEAAARNYARGEDVEDHTLDSAPAEIRSLRRTLAAMAKTLRGREHRLIDALSEERALLREVNHRVKNNLQMVASLLSIQARAARDESEAWGLSRAHDRVQLLALVHQRIYSSGEVRSLALDGLVTDVARQMLAARGQSAQNIRLAVDVGPAQATADRAVPLAFLVGEGLSNALDAVGQAKAEVCLRLREDATGLRIAIDADVSEPAAEPPGATRLIDAFARQLGAQIGRPANRPFMLWINVPATKPAAVEENTSVAVSAGRASQPKQEAQA